MSFVVSSQEVFYSWRVGIYVFVGPVACEKNLTSVRFVESLYWKKSMSFNDAILEWTYHVNEHFLLLASYFYSFVKFLLHLHQSGMLVSLMEFKAARKAVWLNFTDLRSNVFGARCSFSILESLQDPFMASISE